MSCKLCAYFIHRPKSAKQLKTLSNNIQTGLDTRSDIQTNSEHKFTQFKGGYYVLQGGYYVLQPLTDGLFTY